MTTVEPAPDISFWPVGPEFKATEVRIDGVVEQVNVTMQSLSTGKVGIGMGVCGYGGGARHRIVDGTLELLQTELVPTEFLGCVDVPPEDERRAEAITEMFLNDPAIEVGELQFGLSGERVRLVVTTPDASANVPVVDSEVRYYGVESSIPGVVVEGMSFITRAIFAAEIQLETCLVHMQIGGLQTIDARDEITGARTDECPNASASDEAVVAFPGEAEALASRR